MFTKRKWHDADDDGVESVARGGKSIIIIIIIIM
jgi:hypothetical protein